MRVPSVVISTSHHFTAKDLPFGITLDPEQSHHLLHVLKRKKGDPVNVIFTNSAQRASAVIATTLVEQLCQLSITKLEDLESGSSLTLLAAYPKNSTADFIVEKAVEIGVDRIIFFISDHTPRKPGNEELENKLARFRRIAESALKQSRSEKITEVSISENLGEAISLSLEYFCNSREILKIVLTPGSEVNLLSLLAKPVQQPQQSVLLEQYHQPADSILIVGAEGGLSNREQNLAAAQDFLDISLGTNILRMETAVIASCTVLAIHASLSKRLRT